MTAFASPGAIRAPSRGREPHDAAAALLRRCFRALTREYRAYCGLRAMMALDDRMLSDIGLVRAEVESAAHYGRKRNG